MTTQIPAAGPKDAQRPRIQSAQEDPLIWVTWNDDSKGTPITVLTPKNSIYS